MRDVILHKLISMNFEDIDSEGLVISFYLTDQCTQTLEFKCHLIP